jgi:hypothetical protein
MSTYDPRFDEAEAEVDRGDAWLPREDGMPNPLTIVAVDWSSGTTSIGPAEWLNGRDRDDRRWSILVGSTILKKRLIEGVIEEWNDDEQRFVEVGREGKVKPGELVSLKFKGDRQGSKYKYPVYEIVRKPALEQSASSQDDDVPF